jgi:hypothetical protein
MSRVPAYDTTNPDGMLIWFAEMAKRDLLFHPDDDPADIVRLTDGTSTFTVAETVMLRETIASMFAEHHDGVYDAAHPIFMHASGLRLDA